MIKLYREAVSKENCFSIYRAIMNEMLSSKDFPHNISNNKDNLLGDNWGIFDYGPSNELLPQFQHNVIHDFGSNYVFTHNYTRVYFGSTHLNPHIDRNGLDLTLSLSIHSTVSEPWPIWVSEFEIERDEWYTEDRSNKDFLLLKTKSKAYNLEVGDAVCITKQHPHWRDEIKFNGEHIVQVFYHWKRVT